MKCVKGLCLLTVVVFCSVSAWADSGVRGRVAWRGELVPDVTVRAYSSVAAIAAGDMIAASAPTGLDGVYELDLPAGSYVLTARTGAGPLKPGDYFCYYNGSPVQVPAQGYRNVGFNLVQVPETSKVEQATRSGIRGELSFQGELLEQAYLYVYKDPSRYFKGPGYFIQPVAKGTFRLNLPPGDYYLLARKRERGGQFGPIETGDYFNYYYGNPVRIGPGEIREIKIETVTRQSMLEEDVVAFQGVRGRVLDGQGQPQAGLYVFAYRDPDMTGTPDYFSAPTTSEGDFEIALPEGGSYFLLARQAFGGPAEDGEFYGKLQQSDGAPQAVSANEKEVVIHVAPKTL